MKKQYLFVFLILLTSGLLAQEVSKRVVVEHFTNTRCGVCANRNPGFYQNLDNHPEVIHLSIHPSRPYSDCVLHQHNSSENDGRTNYYGILGSTPRLVIQGSPIAVGANYGSATIFEDELNQTTPVSIELYQVKENDQLQVDVVIRAATDNTIGTANLFLAAAEQAVNYAAPNREMLHRDVFRRTFTDNPTGLAVAVPATGGEQFVSRYTLPMDDAWSLAEMFVVAILNDATDRSVIQAAASDPADNEPLVSSQNLQLLPLQLFPNPVRDRLEVRLPQDVPAAQATLLDAAGKVLLRQAIGQRGQLGLGHLPAGNYWLEVRAADQMTVQQIVKE